MRTVSRIYAKIRGYRKRRHTIINLTIMKYLYILYQYLIAWPLFALLTILTALLTIVWMFAPNSLFINSVQRCWSRSFFILMLLPVKVSGKENIQKGQSYVFVSNHQSICDVFLAYGYLPVIFKFLMKKELRKIPFVGLACQICGHVYIDRSNMRAAVVSIKKVEQTLKNGICTVIYPEGTRTPNGEVQKFKRGAFMVATHLSLPVIPLSVSGGYECMPKGAKYMKRHPIHLHIGKPMNLKEYETEEAATEAVRQAVIEGMKK